MPAGAAAGGDTSRPAHRLAAKERTADVRVSEDVTFAGLLLSEPVLLGLQQAGFERPSPIQLRAIPLGRCGVDLIVQAKSGTGKTCVLAVLALELLAAAAPSGRCQALVLAPTREVAVQVAQVVAAIGSHVPGLAVHTLIGGLPLAQDVANLRRCQVAVGTPGRVRQLVDSEALNTDAVRLFVMDEADKLMEDAFVDDINFIYSTLPASKQMVALSATYPETLADLLARYMRTPTFVRLGKSSSALLGIRQYVLTVPYQPLVQKQLKLKLDALVHLLSTVSFTQCLVFSNHQTRAETLSTQLTARGWPSTHLSSALSQERRLEALARLTSLRCRVLVATDLGARGVDSEHADLVVQLDVPWDGATYLHRVGRAGRYDDEVSREEAVCGAAGAGGQRQSEDQLAGGDVPRRRQDWDTPRRTGQAAGARADTAADSDSGDSFSALLEAYKRDQERQRDDWSSGDGDGDAREGRTGLDGGDGDGDGDAGEMRAHGGAGNQTAPQLEGGRETLDASIEETMHVDESPRPDSSSGEVSDDEAEDEDEGEDEEAGAVQGTDVPHEGGAGDAWRAARAPVGVPFRADGWPCYLKPMLDYVRQQRGFSYGHLDAVARLFVKEALSSAEDVPTCCPPGVFVRPLDSIHLDTVKRFWPYTADLPDIDGVIRDGMTVGLSAGVFVATDNDMASSSVGQLVCWAVLNRNAVLGFLRTLETHRRRGLASSSEPFQHLTDVAQVL
ncbi:ATP-dependent RNA helicase DbpA-like [Pollicipes pollicipes]|uniref:ATP-dependent RNA helicase DbpA-like n=1 Tax=Pollicipes pollicipes TaxID=41117 RepID=UPI00188559CF|nr:ATP-dependent RNA helicase DbpA-like [Pollicipes pollicipes]